MKKADDIHSHIYIHVINPIHFCTDKQICDLTQRANDI